MGIVPPAPGCPADHPLLVAQLESTFIVSLAHGVELERGAAHSATSLGDCEGSADDLEGAWLGQVLPDADPELVIVHERGGKNVGEYDLEIWKVAADKPERIFSTPVESYEGTSRSVATATLAPDGTIHVQRGETSEVWAVGPDGTFVKR